MSELITNCKTAPLHLIGQIQSYGLMLVVARDSGTVSACSANTDSFLGLQPAAVLGRRWSELNVGGIDLDDLTGRLTAGGARVPSFVSARLASQDVVVQGHGSEDLLLIEIEPLAPALPSDHGDRLLFLQELADCRRADEAAQLLLRYLADITGFDRVMLYQFMPDWHGKVVAEKLRPGMEGFLGLHFPAGDIPENARRLYAVNMQRFIADVDGDVADILTASDTSLNLTHAQLRAVHPVHIQYLKNMGVSASFSVSIVVGGSLWGMIACHHMKTKMLGFRQRNLCEELARIVSLHMSGLLALETERRESVLEVSLTLLNSALRSGESASSTLSTVASQLMTSFAADSLWIMLDESPITRELQLSDKEQQVLVKFLAAQDQKSIKHYDAAVQEFRDHPGLLNSASGLLHIPLGGHGFITLLRKEQIEKVQWAGRVPGDSAEPATELTPRASFQAWAEEVHGKATPWSQAEINTAASLQNLLLAWFEKQDLEQQALADNLTGLANRRLFEQSLDNALAVSQGQESTAAVFMLDLDEFKQVNDIHGHAAGDELLVQVGERLKALVRGRDVVARFGGDEFAVILYHVRGSDEVAEVARRIVEKIRQPFQLKEAEVTVGVSIGIALFPRHGDSRQTLLENADVALYEVKRRGRNGFRFFGDSGH